MFSIVRSQLVLSLIFAMCTLTATQSCAQVENTPITEEVSLDKLYLGLLANTQIAMEDLESSNELTFQGGARVKLWLVPQVLQVRSFGVFRIAGRQTIQSFTNFEAILSPAKGLNIHLGVMATPTTELRPNPSTWQSQVETNAESTILGGRPGIKVKYAFSKTLEIAYGIYNQENEPAHHLKLKFKKLAISGFLSSQGAFLAAKWSDHKTEFVTTYDEKSLSFSSITEVFEHTRIYSEIAFDVKFGTKLFSKMGIRRDYSSPVLSGFFSLSYDRSAKLIEGGFFMHI